MIRAGQPLEYLFVVLEGELEIPASDSLPRLRLGPGALLWENDYLRHIPPKRSVYAATHGVLLCVRPSDVDARVRDDPPFGLRILQMLKTYALEHVQGGAPKPPGPAPAKPAPQRSVPEMIKRLLDGDFE